MLALRHLDVALAVFLSYMSPIYIALVAPRLLRQRTEPVVVVALVLAVSGIVVMLAPGLMDPALRVSTLGVALGLASGLLLAVFFLVAKTLSADVDGSTMLISNGVIVAAVMLPFGLVQWAGAGFAFVLTDLLGGAGAGRLQHRPRRHDLPPRHAVHRGADTSIVGLLEPASAPVFALVFLAERPSLWTLLGGVLILCGAVLVVLLGATEEGLAGVARGSRRRGRSLVVRRRRDGLLEADRAARTGRPGGRWPFRLSYARTRAGCQSAAYPIRSGGGPRADRRRRSAWLGAVVVPGRAGSGGSPA